MTVPTSQRLISMAADAAETSYSPYSRFRVGAAIITDSGDVVVGSNIENAAFGASVCAETNAITSAIADGATRITTVAVVCLDGDLCTPCGNCRQVMREFGVENVLMQNDDGTIREVSLTELLPDSFGPEALAHS